MAKLLSTIPRRYFSLLTQCEWSVEKHEPECKPRLRKQGCAESGARFGWYRYFTGMTVPAGTGTAVTLFCGEPSIRRSEYVR